MPAQNELQESISCCKKQTGFPRQKSNILSARIKAIVSNARTTNLKCNKLQVLYHCKLIKNVYSHHLYTYVLAVGKYSWSDLHYI